MKIIRTIKQMRRFIRDAHLRLKTIGFVPTMGALHEGHLSLVRQARKENDLVVVSIFVNPVQFGPKEDFAKYPRDLNKDASLCRKEGVDFIFYPSIKQMYPVGYKTYVKVNDLSDCLCGRSRPGHFQGVTTVVTKLFNIIQPDIAYFGQKDAQQAIIIKKLVCDLNIPVKIKVMPIVREKDGLALSSRNIYLNEKERKDAVVLYKALNKARELIRKGNRDSQVVISQMKKIINAVDTARIDYISIVDQVNLKPVKRITKGCLIALAVYIGKTRLIDNIVVG